MPSLLPSEICNLSRIFFRNFNWLQLNTFLPNLLLTKSVQVLLKWKSFALSVKRINFFLNKNSIEFLILNFVPVCENYAELFVGRAGFRPARKSADEANLLDFQTFSPVQGVLAYCQFWFLEKDLVVKSCLSKSVKLSDLSVSTWKA